jgi:hypothetical protein
MPSTSETDRDQDAPPRSSGLWDTPDWAFMAKWPSRAIPAVREYFDYAIHALYLGYTSARALDPDPSDPMDMDGHFEQRIVKRAVHYGLRADASPAPPVHVGKLILAGRLGAEWVRETIASQDDETLRTLLKEVITSVWNRGGGLVGDGPKIGVVQSVGALHRHVTALGYDRDPMIGPVLNAIRLYASAPSALGAHAHVARALTRPSLARHHQRYDEQHVLGRALTNMLS